MVEVTQEDREAAKWYHGPTCQYHSFSHQLCTCGVEKAFARHRIAAREAALALTPEERINVATVSAYESGRDAGMIEAAGIAKRLYADLKMSDWVLVGKDIAQAILAAKESKHG